MALPSVREIELETVLREREKHVQDLTVRRAPTAARLNLD
jgi:hypothetical protein